MATTFRKDITGLRALAVLTVVLFHLSMSKGVDIFNTASTSTLGSNLLSYFVGGFVGVDIFFVISGFLMTSIIMKGLNNESFSFLDFYKKRAKRIVPALLIVVLITILIFDVFLQRYATGREAFKALVFTTNFHYLKRADYFHSDPLSWFLLHTWSLSVEWQFYLLYPLIIVAVKKVLGIKHIGKTILILTLVSFVFAMYEVHHNQRAAYYMLHSRAFEMLVGGLAYFYPLKALNSLIEKKDKFKAFVSYKNASIESDLSGSNTIKPAAPSLVYFYLYWLTSDKRASLFKYLGMLLIIISLFVANSNDGWPNPAVILPILGAYLVIATSEQKTILDTVIFQKIGLWSYSIYLVHWTVLVVNYNFGFNSSPLILLLVVLVLGYLLHITVEKRRNYGYKFLAVYLIVLCSIFTYADHFQAKLNEKASLENANHILSNGSTYVIEMTDGEPTVFGSLEKKIEFILYGDSYARQYVHSLEDYRLNFIADYCDGCYFLGGGAKSYRNDYVAKTADKSIYFKTLLNLAAKYPDTPLIIAQNFAVYKDFWRKDDANLQPVDKLFFLNVLKKDLTATLSELTKITKAPIIFVLPQYSNYTKKSQTCTKLKDKLNASLYNVLWCNKDEELKQDYVYHTLYQIASSFSQVHIIQPTKYLCDINTTGELPPTVKCKTNFADGVSMYYDENHLSYAASRIVVPYILEAANVSHGKAEEPNHGYDHSQMTRLKLGTLEPYKVSF